MFWAEIEAPVGRRGDIKAHPLLVGNETKSWDIYLPLNTAAVEGAAVLASADDITMRGLNNQPTLLLTTLSCFRQSKTYNIGNNGITGNQLTHLIVRPCILNSIICDSSC